jgi:hypothetical protein
MRQETLAERMERTKLVTQHYHQLQGLKQIPVGLLFLVLVIDQAGWWPWFAIWHPISGVVAIGLAFGGIWLIGRYYDQTIGRVKHPLSTRSYFMVIAGLILFFAVQWAEFYWQWPISASMLVFSLMYWLGFWFTGRLLYHYLVAGFLIIMVGLLPLTGLVTASQVYVIGSENAPGVAFLGLIIIVTGLVDHWWLTRSLQSLREGVE